MGYHQLYHFSWISDYDQTKSPTAMVGHSYNCQWLCLLLMNCFGDVSCPGLDVDMINPFGISS